MTIWLIIAVVYVVLSVHMILKYNRLCKVLWRERRLNAAEFVEEARRQAESSRARLAEYVTLHRKWESALGLNAAMATSLEEARAERNKTVTQLRIDLDAAREALSGTHLASPPKSEQLTLRTSARRKGARRWKARKR